MPMTRIGFSISADIYAGNIHRSSLRGSPTDALRKYVVDALQNGYNLARIGRIDLLDTNKTVKDSTSSLSFSKPSINQIRIESTVTASSTYSIAYIYLYDVNGVLYFTIPISPPISIYSGYIIHIFITITVKVSATLSGDFAGLSYTESISRFVADVLSGVSDDVYGVLKASNLKISDIVIAIASGSLSPGEFSILRLDDYTIRVYKKYSATSVTTLSQVCLYANVIDSSTGKQTPIMCINILKTYASGTNLYPTFELGT